MLKLLKRKVKSRPGEESSGIEERMEEIVKKHRNNGSGPVEILQDISVEFSYLPEEALNTVSERMQIPLSRLYSLATFYKSFKLEPPGRHRINVCTGTACHVKGAAKIVDTLKRELDVDIGETTDDGEFQLETVNCLGVCALAPAVVVDDRYYEKVNPGDVKEILDEVKKDNRDT